VCILIEQTCIQALEWIDGIDLDEYIYDVYIFQLMSHNHIYNRVIFKQRYSTKAIHAAGRE